MTIPQNKLVWKMALFPFFADPFIIWVNSRILTAALLCYHTGRVASVHSRESDK